MSVTFSDIEAARSTLSGVINKTPIVSDEKLSNAVGASAYLKAECLQRAGSFKIRGAYNTISQLSDEERSRGVTAGSAGNHAQGVAMAARLSNTKAVIVVPECAPLTKVLASRAQGAEVIRHGDTFDAAVAYSQQLQKAHGYTYVHAFDDERVIAGQGTIGIEIFEELTEDCVAVVPICVGVDDSGTYIATQLP